MRNHYNLIMKKALSIILILFLTACVYAQKSVVFKSGYLPRHTYNTTANTVLDMNMLTTNDSVHVTAPKAKRDVMAIEMRMGWNADLKTNDAAGKKGPIVSITGKRFSAKTTVGGAEGPLPMNNALSGQTISGLVNDKGRIILDTTANNFLSQPEIVRGTMGILINGLPSKIKFPLTALKVGDSFTEDILSTTLTIANIGFNQDIVIKCTYKLIAIKGNLAYFDTISEFTKDFTMQDKGRTLIGKTSGNGAGKIIFNIAKTFPESVINNEEVGFYVETGLKKMNIKIKRTIDAQYTMAAN
jgi:hypothetical protein